MPPAIPEFSRGAAAMIAALFAGVNRPSPTPTASKQHNDRSRRPIGERERAERYGDHQHAGESRDPRTDPIACAPGERCHDCQRDRQHSELEPSARCRQPPRVLKKEGDDEKYREQHQVAE